MRATMERVAAVRASMERVTATRTPPVRRGLWALAACAAALAIAACGSGGHEGGHLNFKGHTHPDVAELLSVAVSNSQVIVSPAHVGAGQFVVSVVNTASTPVEVRLQGTSGKLRGKTIMSTGKIAAGESAQVKTGALPGKYLVTSSEPIYSGGPLVAGGSRGVKPSTLQIGATRDGNNLIQEP